MNNSNPKANAHPTAEHRPALGKLETLLPSDRVILGEKIDPSNCSGIFHRPSIILFPTSSTEVAAIIEEALRSGVPLYPVSRGKNWGYGSASPWEPGAAVVNLSRMDRILSFDEETGIVTLEPGVTQKGLFDYLQRIRAKFLVPTTGAGPDCSIVGNALERGFGLTPSTDHFASVMALEAVLPDGSIYRSPLREFGGTQSADLFKWGVGPYLDGLFSQGHFGIVTSATIALAPKPEHIEAFFFSGDEAAFPNLVAAVRESLRDVGAVAGAVNLMNRERVISMSASCPEEAREEGRAVNESEWNRLAGELTVNPWSGMGALYGHKDLVRAAKKRIRTRIKPFTKQFVFLTPWKVALLTRLARWVPSRWAGFLSRNLQTVKRAFDIVSGVPSTAALPLTHWRSRRPAPANGECHPDSGDIGLLWYSPLVPLKGEEMRSFIASAKDICRRWGIDPLMTFTAFSDRVADCTLPILFNRSNPKETERAHSCYRDLFEAGRAMGILPYRVGMQGTPLLETESTPYGRLLCALKHAADPQAILAPRRWENRHKGEDHV